MTSETREPIAIVGIGCRFPGGVDSPLSMWRLLAGGVDGIREVPADRWSADAFYDPERGRRGKISTRQAGFIDDIARFDAELFGISAREAAHMDPQHRLVLEVAWAGIEDAGMDPRALAGTDAAVFVGLMLQDYLAIQTSVHNRELIDGQTVVGMGACMAANRISHALDLRGPSVVLDTACSSSLVAAHLACQSIRSGDASLALVGGVNLMLRPEPTIAASQARMLAPDGRCKGFDRAADGYSRSEGAGVIVLRPLADALADDQRVYAVIRGSAVNQDGRTPRVTLPSGGAQKQVVRSACRRAGVSPADLQYVEAHGTGTPVGDPIEARALGEVLSEGRQGPACLLGSIKSNIGHAEAAAGVAALIKTALALHHEQVPAHLHFHAAPEGLDLAALGLRIPTTLEAWPAAAGRRIAGINSFGLGGTNAHLILEGVSRRTVPTTERAHLVVLSARTDAELERSRARLLELVRDDQQGASLAEISRSSARRARLEHRIACVARSKPELAQLFDELAAGRRRPELALGVAPDSPPQVAFVLGGTGQVWPELGRRLLDDEPSFRATIDECERALSEHVDWSLSEELRRPAAHTRLDQLEIAQPALFAVQLALAALWRSWGVEPDVVIGHSAGEVAAAQLAGALGLDDAVRLIHHRSRLQARCRGGGAMLAANLEPDRARALLEGRPQLCVAAINSATSVTIAGPREHLIELAGQLEQLGRFHRFVPGDVAFHSPDMDPLIPELLDSLAGIRPRPPQRAWWSTVTAEPVDFAPGPEYWARNLREVVRFGPAIAQLCATPTAFIELGAHPVLASSLRECLAARGTNAAVVGSLRRDQPEREAMLTALASLHVHGVPARIEATCGDAATTSLPSYPFAGQRHWIESPRGRQLRLGLGTIDEIDEIDEPEVEPAVERAPIEPTPTSATTPAPIDIEAQLREQVARVFAMPAALLDLERPLASLGLDSVMAVELAADIEHSFGVRVPMASVLAGPSVARLARLVRGEVVASDSSWLLPLSRPTAARLRLICLPYAGGVASVFAPWVRLLPADVELWAVRLPGSLDREHEPPFEQMQPLVDALLEQLDPILDPPFAFYGHSLGALVAFALTRELHSRGRPLPAQLCVAAHPSPRATTPATLPSLAAFEARLGDPEFLRSIGYLEQLADFASDRALLASLAPALRAAFAMQRDYRPPPEPRLPCPVFAYVGANDRVADEAQLRGWAQYTSAEFRLRRFDGGHLFLREAAVELTRALRCDLGLDADSGADS